MALRTGLARGAGVDEFHYRLPGPIAGLRPGLHRSAQLGDGLEVRDHQPFGDGVDARRLDLRASLRDPFERLLVRRYAQRSSISVFSLLDLSASMAVSGRFDAAAHGSKMQMLSDFVESLGLSAYRTSDAFACYGCAESILPGFTQPLSRSRGAGAELAARLRAHKPDGRNANALLEAALGLPGRNGLVFLVSDFHLPLTLVDSVLDALGRHLTVPVVLGGGYEMDTLPAFGFARIEDAETAEERTVWMRPSLRARMLDRLDDRRTQLHDVMALHGCRPLELTGAFSADAVTRYFFA